MTDLDALLTGGIEGALEQLRAEHHDDISAEFCCYVNEDTGADHEPGCTPEQRARWDADNQERNPFGPWLVRKHPRFFETLLIRAALDK